MYKNNNNTVKKVVILKIITLNTYLYKIVEILTSYLDKLK